MTGRAAGFCAGFGVPGYANPAGRGLGFGGGFGRGRGGGGGRGWRNRFYATGLTGWQRAAMGAPGYVAAPGFAAPAAPGGTQIEVLTAQAQYLQQALEDVRRQLDQLKAEGGADR